MSENNFQQIKKIAAAFNLKNETIYFGGESTGIIFNGDPENNTLQLLTNIIYHHCYSRCHFSFKHEPITINEEVEKLNTSFLNNLLTANTTDDAIDNGWTVEELNETNTVLAAKKEYRIIANAGNYLKQSRASSELKSGEEISMQLFKDFWTTGDHFYFISGQQQHDWWNSGSKRFYWNLQPEGASLLVNLITKQFNRFGIPFGFKCVATPHSYNRCDNSVLYLANCYLTIGLKLLKEIHPLVSNFLNDEVPLFTLKLAKGMSFAENPPWHQISFGQSRSHVIARGLIKTWSENISDDTITEMLHQTIIENNLNPEKFYLNPGSAFEYDFSDFNS